jgi:hypothetical protein
MLFKFNKATKAIAPLGETDFASHSILERQDIERWVEEHPDILGEDLLMLSSEYDRFDKTSERLDLLALDKEGTVSVIELKRDDSGRHLELQAIKYAAYCSTMTLRDVISLRADYLARKGNPTSTDEVKNDVLAFIEKEDFEEINDTPRIILVSKEFRPEVTASVLWLRKFGLDLSCIKLTPYNIDDETIGLVSTKIIPLPEAEDYQIRTEQKESKERSLTRTQEEYLRFFGYLKEGLEKGTGRKLPQPRPTYV